MTAEEEKSFVINRTIQALTYACEKYLKYWQENNGFKSFLNGKGFHGKQGTLLVESFQTRLQDSANLAESDQAEIALNILTREDKHGNHGKTNRGSFYSFFITGLLRGTGEERDRAITFFIEQRNFYPFHREERPLTSMSNISGPSKHRPGLVTQALELYILLVKHHCFPDTHEKYIDDDTYQEKIEQVKDLHKEHTKKFVTDMDAFRSALTEARESASSNTLTL